MNKIFRFLVSGVMAVMLLLGTQASCYAKSFHRDILDTPVPVDSVKSIQVVDDTYVRAGGGVYTIEAFAPNGDTNLGTGADRTYVAIYDALRTSDLSSGGNRQVGAIAGIPTFPSSTEAVVTIDTTRLAAGTYWLRFITMLADGTWEVAEGVLLVH